jgi:hypothetical protein
MPPLALAGFGEGNPAGDDDVLLAGQALRTFDFVAEVLPAVLGFATWRPGCSPGAVGGCSGPFAGDDLDQAILGQLKEDVG